MGALAEFGGIHKKVEIGDWITTTPVWVDRPTPKEEGRRESDGIRIGYRMIGGRGGRESVHNTGLDPQLQIMERLGEITSSTHS